jgi:hypothetical protein
MKTIIAILLTITTALGAYEISVSDDPFSNFIEISGPRLESSSGDRSIRWVIVGSVDRRNNAVQYTMIYSSVYSNRSVRRDNLTSLRLPGPVILQTQALAQDSTYQRGGNYVHMEMHAAIIPAVRIETMHDFQVSGGMTRIAGTVPPGYIQALTDAVQGVVDSLQNPE